MLAGLALSAVPAAGQLARPELRGAPAAPEVSTDGTLDLSWRIDPAAGADLEFELEESIDGGEPVRIPAGAHDAAALSGRDDGAYRYRVRAVAADGTAGAWSEPVELRVEHHSLALAFSIFAIGAVVFVATAALVLTGDRSARGATD
ncbi:MAG: fibronectin type III domain-containing protein [Planctomycetes bacterium]|nr:fibronectin type III domain-containing protein [Planctomycetota bacterium]